MAKKPFKAHLMDPANYARLAAGAAQLAAIASAAQGVVSAYRRGGLKAGVITALETGARLTRQHVPETKAPQPDIIDAEFTVIKSGRHEPPNS